MYHPYFRGKQYELLTIRESAQTFKDAGFVPVIEPVKEALAGLTRALDAIKEAQGEAIVVINPNYGQHAENGDGITEFLNDKFEDYDKISRGILLSEDSRIDDVERLISENKDYSITLIHIGFSEARSLVERIGDGLNEFKHIFQEDRCGKLYRKHFRDSQKKILLRDGFEKRTNRKHPPVEFFSDLHATYQEEGVEGFGDFLIVGDDYAESGGPAYAIAIHLTFIDDDRDEEMHIHHFKSIRQDDPKDPAGKFAEALQKLVDEVNASDTKILKTTAVEAFLDLHQREHFPGLGSVKRLSMKHHIETLANYFENN